ncbi:hypothetical protein V8B55DRAFT_1454119 [Mucor lusitanicus]|uniref:Uncharacterized protein n=2 Tax=Mucor circinelloides f. lusitanicus TaxID=29924 RepID=A0A162Z193_MUCCL|nr:hypothetical protein FB192DRAFT_1348973 [Mucor lusitanicus]OAD01787.1 hypothetical protein MUCCIDRAFT_111128 [Mucor lusitanicus CBS 277.49]
MMDNPSNNPQDSMSFKAARMAYQLVESTERFLTTVGELNNQSASAMGSNLNDHITRVIQQYENVCMIVNALQAISLCVGDPQNRNSLLTAATSASTSSSTALSRIYSQFSSLQIDDDTAKESLGQLGSLVQHAKFVNVKLEEGSSTTSPQPKQISPPPANQDIDNERRELALKRKQFDEEREEFERERKRLLLDKESAHQQLKQQQLIEQQQQQQQQQKLQLQQQRHEQRIIELQKQEREQKEKEQQDKEKLAKQKHQIHVLSTDQFLEQFEKTAQTFAQSINMDLDNVWESMLIHALPKDKLPWADETIIGKKHSWRYAKQLYHEKYAGNSGSAPSSPTGRPLATAAPSSSMPTAATANATAGAPSNGVATPAITTTTTVNAPLSPLQKLLARSAASTPGPSPKERDQRRVADYCQHLLSLEMKFYDTIEEYNKRYIRYCVIANVDLTGKSFIERYIRSLDPKYRKIVQTALQLRKQPLNNIKEVMAVAEETINAYIAASPPRRTTPYSQNCVHNHKVNQTV